MYLCWHNAYTVEHFWKRKTNCHCKVNFNMMNINTKFYILAVYFGGWL